MLRKNLVSVFVIILAIIIVMVLLSSGETSKDKVSENTEPNLVAGRVVGYVKSEKLGNYLTDSSGMTLYTFADDKKLQSTCYGECAKNWMPFKWDTTQKWETLNDVQAKKMNAVKRSDGTYQTAYGEKPLYYYAGDTRPGDVNGNGLGGGKWSIVLITE